MKKLVHSFRYAFNGVVYAFKTQLNFRIHTISGILAIGLGIFFGLSTAEWLWVAFAITSVLAAELMNTALEILVDLVSPEKNPKAGAIKDLAAGAVLIVAMFALVVGLFVFVPKIIHYVA